MSTLTKAQPTAPMTDDAVKRNDVNVKMDAEVVRLCKIVSSSRGVPMAEYLSDLVRPLVQRDLKTEMSRQFQPSPPRKPKAGD